MSEERYRLEIYRSGSHKDLLASYRSDHPFLGVAVGDVIDSSCLHFGQYHRAKEMIDNAVAMGADETKLGEASQFPIPQPLRVREVRHILIQRMRSQGSTDEINDVYHSISLFTENATENE